jgi:ArsR family transcriptional regulator
MKKLARVFKALADETRLKILALLFEHEELCVCDLTATLGITQSKASRHLRYLVNAGILSDRREGTWMLYRVVEQADEETSLVLDTLKEVLKHYDLTDLEKALQSHLANRVKGVACPRSSLKRRPK